MEKTVFRIALSGGATQFSQADLQKAEQIGKSVAESGCLLLSGACPGIPYAAVMGARKAGGKCFGVSPAKNLQEHLKINYPTEGLDFITFTGFGYEIRNATLVRNCDAMIFVGGQVGTLQEFTIAFAEEKVIGVLEGTDGISSGLAALAEKMGSKFKPKLLFSSSPSELVKLVIQELSKANK